MGRQRKRKTTCNQCRHLGDRLVSLEKKFKALEEVLAIYPLKEVLKWRKHITHWDTWLDLYPPSKSLRLVYKNLTNVHSDLVELIIEYGELKKT
jgi:ribosomal 50S subunit-associated protein YjgA (DUF615 family)